MSVATQDAERASTVAQLRGLDDHYVSVCTVDITAIRLCDHGDEDCGRATCCVLVPGEQEADFLCPSCAMRVVAGWLVVRRDEFVTVSVSW